MLRACAEKRKFRSKNPERKKLGYFIPGISSKHSMICGATSIETSLRLGTSETLENILKDDASYGSDARKMRLNNASFHVNRLKNSFISDF